MAGKLTAMRGNVEIAVGGTGQVCFFGTMAEDDEWNMPEPAERPPVSPEQLDRYRGLLTELMFCVIGAPVFGLASVWIRPSLNIPSSLTPLPPRPEWEVLLYRWGPVVMFALAFFCLAWLVVVMLRMADLKKERA